VRQPPRNSRALHLIVFEQAAKFGFFNVLPTAFSAPAARGRPTGGYLTAKIRRSRSVAQGVPYFQVFGKKVVRFC
ncbi:MAG: hypothetical protein ACLFOY_18385, partial [Desulfatibacillaceae bacterium]